MVIMPLDIVAVVLVAGVFAYLYIGEKEFVFKYVWLFVCLSVLSFGMFNDYVLNTTTYNTTTGITQYSYALSNNLNWLGTGLSLLLVGMIGLFVWLLYKRVIKDGI
jgi:hypothetical protein